MTKRAQAQARARGRRDPAEMWGVLLPFFVTSLLIAQRRYQQYHLALSRCIVGAVGYLTEYYYVGEWSGV